MAPAWRYGACFTLLVLWISPWEKRWVNAASSKSEEERRAEYERFLERMMDIMPAEELAEELVGAIHRNIESGRRRKGEIASRVDDTDDEALLERFGRLVVRWINTRLTPRSDEECKWNWGRWRCDPQCFCKYRYRFGDYAPGRSCRLRPLKERGMDTCDPEAGNNVSLLEKLALFVRKVTRRTWRFTTEHVVPQTDKECRFSLARTLEEKRPFCSPRKYCAFHYKFGDIHPGRSCRLRQPGDQQSPPLSSTTHEDDEDDDADHDSRESDRILAWLEGEGRVIFEDPDRDSSNSFKEKSNSFRARQPGDQQSPPLSSTAHEDDDDDDAAHDSREGDRSLRRLEGEVRVIFEDPDRDPSDSFKKESNSFRARRPDDQQSPPLSSTTHEDGDDHNADHDSREGDRSLRQLEGEGRVIFEDPDRDPSDSFKEESNSFRARQPGVQQSPPLLSTAHEDDDDHDADHGSREGDRSLRRLEGEGRVIFEDPDRDPSDSFEEESNSFWAFDEDDLDL